jgi:anti-sigma B factor antagonist
MDEKASAVKICSQGRVVVVGFRNTTISDVEAVLSASREVKEYIEQNHPKRLIFDFDNVKFFSSQVLGMLLDIRAKVEMYSGQVVISSINPQLHRVFRITNLDKIFRFFPDKDSAVEAIGTS